MTVLVEGDDILLEDGIALLCRYQLWIENLDLLKLILSAWRNELNPSNITLLTITITVMLLLSVISGRLSNVTNLEFCGGFVNINSAIARELVHASTLDFSRESKCSSKFEVLGDEKPFLTWIK